MNIQTKETYSEVYSVLNMLGENYINKLPKSLVNMIKEEKSDTYNPKYVLTLQLSEQKIKRESLAMIALFHLNFWCNSDEEKEKLRNLFKTNEKIYQEETREKYNPDNVFKSRIKEKAIISNKVSMIEYKESIFKKVYNKIISIFYKK